MDYIGPHALLVPLRERKLLCVTPSPFGEGELDLTCARFPLPPPWVCRHAVPVDLSPYGRIWQRGTGGAYSPQLGTYPSYYLELLAIEGRLVPDGWLSWDDAVKLGIGPETVRSKRMGIKPLGEDRKLSWLQKRAEKTLADAMNCRTDGPWLRLLEVFHAPTGVFEATRVDFDFRLVPIYHAREAPRRLLECALEDLKALSVLNADVSAKGPSDLWWQVADRFCLRWLALSERELGYEFRDELVRQRLLDGESLSTIAKWLVESQQHPLDTYPNPQMPHDRLLESARVTVAQIKRKLRQRDDLPEMPFGDDDEEG